MNKLYIITKTAHTGAELHRIKAELLKAGYTLTDSYSIVYEYTNESTNTIVLLKLYD